jgi:hypothetical protein
MFLVFFRTQGCATTYPVPGHPSPTPVGCAAANPSWSHRRLPQFVVPPPTPAGCAAVAYPEFSALSLHTPWSPRRQCIPCVSHVAAVCAKARRHRHRPPIIPLHDGFTSIIFLGGQSSFRRCRGGGMVDIKVRRELHDHVPTDFSQWKEKMYEKLSLLGFIVESYWTPTGKGKRHSTSKGKQHREWCKQLSFNLPPSGCMCRSIYRGAQGSHYNALNTPNHLPHQ